MRREDLKIGPRDKGIAPKIHTMPPDGTTFPHIVALDEIDALNTPEMDAFVNLFCRAGNGIGVMSKILNHVSVFYSLFLRTVAKQDQYIRAIGRLTREDIEAEENELGSIHLSELKDLEKDADVRGLFPLLGLWERSDQKTVFVHQMGGQKGHDVAFGDYLNEWEDFVSQYREENGINHENAYDQLRTKGYGEIQAWMFWKYFTGRPLTCSTWNRDFPEIHDEYKQNGDEEVQEWGIRVWGAFGGTYTADLEGLNLSYPNKKTACAFPLGCVQNLEEGLAPFSNRLSWEHEHSRPKLWGGVDDIDSQVMCTHHNRIKGENFLFDVHTLAQIITLHRRR